MRCLYKSHWFSIICTVFFIGCKPDYSFEHSNRVIPISQQQPFWEITIEGKTYKGDIGWAYYANPIQNGIVNNFDIASTTDKNDDMQLSLLTIGHLQNNASYTTQNNTMLYFTLNQINTGTVLYTATPRNNTNFIVTINNYNATTKIVEGNISGNVVKWIDRTIVSVTGRFKAKYM